MKNGLINVIRIALIIMLLGTVTLCALWLPSLVDYIGGFFENQDSFNNAKVLIYVACAILALPLIVVFALGFRFLPELKNDTIFHKKNARLIKIISIILFAVCAIFSLCVIGLLVLGDAILAPALLFVDAIGIIVALMLFVLSRYVENASILKEEVDATL